MTDYCKCGKELPEFEGVLKTVQQNIIDNMWIKQKDFAFSASLAMMSTILSRKFTFQGMSPNLYLLNVAPSGYGKDCPQQKLKEYLIDLKATHLLGAGDYVSDASLMDGLELKPVRLDIMDEAGGILRSVNSGKSEYNGKMADVLAELYTSSNSKFLGRATAESVKGSCYRPNVNILASTTPTGFSEGVTIKAIQKGLMGRFLIFMGDLTQKSNRVTVFPKLDRDTLNKLAWFVTYKPQESDVIIGGIEQEITEVEATDAANARLDTIFEEFDELRVNASPMSPLLPIIARLYQQMVKLVLIHSASRVHMEIPVVDVVDVEFAYKTVLYYFQTFQDVVEKYIFHNDQEKETMGVLNIIKEKDSITHKELTSLTRTLPRRKRNEILEDLIESQYIVADIRYEENGIGTKFYKCI